jgi:hypothetical protein
MSNWPVYCWKLSDDISVFNCWNCSRIQCRVLCVNNSKFIVCWSRGNWLHLSRYNLVIYHNGCSESFFLTIKPMATEGKSAILWHLLWVLPSLRLPFPPNCNYILSRRCWLSFLWIALNLRNTLGSKPTNEVVLCLINRPNQFLILKARTWEEN